MIVGMSALHRSSFLSLGKCFYSTLKMELHPQTLTFFSLLSSFWQTLNISTANDSSFTVLYNIRVFIFQDVCTELHLVQDYNSHSSHPFFNGLSQIDFTHTVPTVLLTQYRQFCWSIGNIKSSLPAALKVKRHSGDLRVFPMNRALWVKRESAISKSHLTCWSRLHKQSLSHKPTAVHDKLHKLTSTHMGVITVPYSKW